MREITVNLLTQSDTEELLKFELKNKIFFEKTCFPRGDEYYKISNFNKIVVELVEEQERDLVYMYIIRDKFNKIVGRINLVSVIRGNFNKAELGYRIGEEHQKKGYATKAVEMVLDEATNKLGLHRIEAGTSNNNKASEQVLIKNGFRLVGIYNKYIQINNNWVDSLIFEKIID